jgi:hypothetical protein
MGPVPEREECDAPVHGGQRLPGQSRAGPEVRGGRPRSALRIPARAEGLIVVFPAMPGRDLGRPGSGRAMGSAAHMAATGDRP